MDEGLRACAGGGFGHPAGRFAHQAAQIAAERADQVHHGIRAGNALVDRLPVAGIAARELHLAEIGERLELERLFRMAGGDPHACSAFEQSLRHVIADEAAATHQHHQLAVQRAAFRHDIRLIPRREKCRSAPSLNPRCAASVPACAKGVDR
jgi:hypothetical protein